MNVRRATVFLVVSIFVGWGGGHAQSSRIVIESDRIDPGAVSSGDFDIYKMREDGAHQTLLGTDNPDVAATQVDDANPDLCPGG
jgi:hypothetical protein